MTRNLLVLSLIVSFAAVAGFLNPPASFAAEDSDSKALFIEGHKCNMCHAVPAADIEAKTKSEKMKGPDLGGEAEADFETIATYMRKAGELDGKTQKKEFKGTDEELQTILDWLGSLEAQE